MALNLKNERAALANTAPNLNETRSGGGEYTPPEAGATRARLVGYIELGKHGGMYQGKPKKPTLKAEILFELSGPKHQPKDGEGDVKIPHRLTAYENVGNHEKNGIIKLFKQLKTETGCEEALNFIDLLSEPGDASGPAWRATVCHETKEQEGKKITRAKLKDKATGAYTFKPTAYDDEESGERKQVKVAASHSQLRLFVWDSPSLDQWDSIFIDGTRDDGTSKNVWQEKIKAAEDFKGSPIYNLLIEAGRDAETVRAAKVDKPEDGGEDEDGDDKPVKPVTPAKAQGALESTADDVDPLAAVS